MACVYCGSKTTNECYKSTLTSVTSYGQKIVINAESEDRVCSEICAKALNKNAIKKNIQTNMTALAKLLRMTNHKSPLNLYILESFKFINGETTRKEFLDTVSSAIEDANETENEEYLQWVCYTHKTTLVLEQEAKEVKLKVHMDLFKIYATLYGRRIK